MRDDDELIYRAAMLGAAHRREGTAPYGDVTDGGSADLMDDAGETSPTTAENHPVRVAMVDAYTTALTGPVEMYRCPCCGDDVMATRPVCGDCLDAGCEMTRDAGGDLNWWGCQRPDYDAS